MLAVVVVSALKRTLPPYYGMSFDFLGYGSWIFAKGTGNADITHFVIQRILNEMSVSVSQMFILFHSRYLLNPGHSRKRIA